MKKLLGIACALAILLGAGALAAQEVVIDLPNGEQGAMTLPNGCALALGERSEVDLDGDGQAEVLQPKMEGIEEEALLVLYVTGTDGAVYSYRTDIHFCKGLYAVDLDGDGKMEILLSGDQYSDDYFTWCLRYDAESGLTPLQFADASRGENTDAYFDSGYGMVIGVDEGSVTLLGSQDVLGTWMASRVFTLKDGRFELNDGGLWKMFDATGESETWEYGCLTLVKDLDVTFEDGSAGTLKAGDKLVVTQSDKVSIVHFQTQDGRRGSFPVEPNVQEGYGLMIYGAPDYDAFEYLPYAD